MRLPRGRDAVLRRLSKSIPRGREEALGRGPNVLAPLALCRTRSVPGTSTPGARSTTLGGLGRARKSAGTRPLFRASRHGEPVHNTSLRSGCRLEIAWTNHVFSARPGAERDSAWSAVERRREVDAASTRNPERSASLATRARVGGRRVSSWTEHRSPRGTTLQKKMMRENSLSMRHTSRARLDLLESSA